MQGSSSFTGEQTSTITIAGKEYTSTTRVLSNYGDRERYILSLKPSPMSVIENLEPLPDAPTIPIPPDVKEGSEAATKYGKELASYQQAKRSHDQAVAIRARLETKAWNESMRPRVVTLEEDQLFDSSLHGIAFRLWRSLRDHHPEVNSVQAALDLIESHGSHRLAEIVSELDRTDEEDKIKNSDGPQADGPETNVSRGHDSTQTSADDIGGHPRP